MGSAGEISSSFDCAAFLRWALPVLGYRWQGFRRVRRQVCKRIGRRLRELHLGDLEAYRQRLGTDPEEWRVLDRFCRISVSRFGRDWQVFERLGSKVLPELVQGARQRGNTGIEAWCAGCARGEEAYSLNAVWRLMVAVGCSDLSFSILATDIDEGQLERAQQGLFGRGSLKELPADWTESLFEPAGSLYSIRPAFRQNIRFVRHDVRSPPPRTGFDLVLCRNLVLTYFDAATRARALEQLTGALRPGGALVIGMREELPRSFGRQSPWNEDDSTIFRSDCCEAEPCRDDGKCERKLQQRR